MKKLFLILFLGLVTVTAKAVKATVCVKAEKAPFLYGWFIVNGKETKINGTWYGTQMTQTITKTNKDGEKINFWYQEFDFPQTSSFNIILNNGLDGTQMRQTDVISDITFDRYFTYDGKTKYTDITENFILEIPEPDTPETQKCATPVIIASGNKLYFECETPGAEFKSYLSTTEEISGGEIVIENKDRIYTLTVYATAPGYARSEPATMKIIFKNGDMNLDGSIDVADIATIIDKMAGK